MKQQDAYHENYFREDTLKTSTDRSFGFVFFVFFTLVGFIIFIKTEHFKIWPFIIAIIFILLAVFSPNFLSPMNRMWTRVGLILHKIISPVIMAIMYYGIITPTGLIMKIIGNDLLKLKFDKSTDSYWIERKPPGLDPDTFHNQF